MSNTDWGTKDYTSGDMAFSVIAAAVKNGLLGGRLVSSPLLNTDKIYIKYYNPGGADNNKLNNTKVTAWIKWVAGNNGERENGYLYARLTGLGTDSTDIGNCYALMIYQNAGVNKLELIRGKPGITLGVNAATTLWTSADFVTNTWYHLQLQVFASGTDVALKVMQDSDGDDVFETQLDAREDSSASKITTTGYCGYGTYHNNAGGGHTVDFDDVNLKNTI